VIVVAVPVILLGAFFVFEYTQSYATAYCPWSHKFNLHASCHIADQHGGSILVEHHDTDIGHFQLSISDRKSTVWLEHPIGSFSDFSPGFDEHTIKIDPDDKQSLLVNGQKFSKNVVSENFYKRVPEP